MGRSSARGDSDTRWMSGSRASRSGEQQPAAEESRSSSERQRALLPDIWSLVKPRRGILAIGFARRLVNRL